MHIKYLTLFKLFSLRTMATVLIIINIKNILTLLFDPISIEAFAVASENRHTNVQLTSLLTMNFDAFM